MMKTITKITLITLLLIQFSQMQAQVFNYGVQAGVNFAVQSPLGDLYNNNEFRTGLNAGVFGNYALNSTWSFQTELNYMQNGSKNDIVTNKYDYVSIPVLANYTFPTQQNAWCSFGLYAGPYVSFLVNAEGVYENNEIDNIDLSENTNSTEMGMVYGFTMKHPINERNLILNLRFGLGLTPYDKDDSSLKNKFCGLGIGYEF